ncbi:pyrroloquinoline quinone biosynthesis protein PqqF [Pantoea sp. SGAir0215]
MHTRSLTLNGLRVTLVHQPDATQAAALVKVAAGSHDEPDNWPGLAHLLEHMLFSGGQRWPDEGRLMSWVQAQGGQVNATTLARQSAFFFEVAPDSLTDGLLRLQDMLSAPRLTPEAITQEIAVIDAEHRLLQHHAAARAEAAIFSTVIAPASFQRFQTGNRAVFGDNVTELQAALRAFHQRFYHAGTMTLWLQGPQPLDELATLAEIFAAPFALRDAGSLPAPDVELSADRRLMLQQDGPSEVTLSWLLPTALSDSVTLLREFLLDEAPGGLLAAFYARGLASQLQIKWLYQSAKTQWLMMTVTGEQPAVVQALLMSFFAALSHTTATQRQHYWHLAQRRLAALSPLMQLQARALGFAATGDCPELSPLLQTLAGVPATTLVCAADVAGESRSVQGYALTLARWQVPDVSVPPVEWFYYPGPNPFPPARLPTTAVTLPHIHPDETSGTLILRPELYSTLAAGQACESALRPVFAVLRHFGGGGEWCERQGVWQLTLDLPADEALLSAALAQLLSCLMPTTEEASSAIPGIAIRELLRQLPYCLASSVQPQRWRAILLGGNARRHQQLAQQLSVLKVNSATLPARAWVSGESRIPHPSDDSAILLFIPLADPQQLAALRALALLYAPRFYQRYRVEHPIGYVVSCRYQRCVDIDGILFALQSPTLSATTLIQYCDDFLQQMTSVKDAADLDGVKTQLAAAQEEPTVEALRQANGLPTLTSQDIAALSTQQLTQLHHQLCSQKSAWRILRTDDKQ